MITYVLGDFVTYSKTSLEGKIDEKYMQKTFNTKTSCKNKSEGDCKIALGIIDFIIND